MRIHIFFLLSLEKKKQYLPKDAQKKLKHCEEENMSKETTWYEFYITAFQFQNIGS